MRPARPMRRHVALGLVGIVGLAMLALAVVRLTGRGPAFAYSTHARRLWDGDCQCPAPVVSDDALYFCGGYASERRERLVAIDLASGQERWRLERPNGCGPVRVLGGALFVWDGAALTAFTVDGTSLWRRTDVFGLPFEVAGRLFLSSRAPALMEVDPRDGRPLKELPIPEVPSATPIVDGDVIHYGTRSGRLVSVNLSSGATKASRVAKEILSPLAQHGAMVIFSAEDASGFRLMAVELETAAVRWTVDTKTLSLAAPVITGERVYFGADRLYEVELSSGASRGIDLSGGPVGTPVLRDHRLYVPGGRHLHVVDLASGEVRSMFAAREWINAPPTAAPAIHQGVVYFGSLDCTVYGVEVEPRAESAR